MIALTEFITFPRSGHHLLVEILQRYFGGDLHYCEMYREPEKSFEKCPETNAQKNHDFELDTEIRPDRAYIVQIRDPFESIASYLEWQWRHSVIVDKEAFNKKTLDYWSKFMAKWVYSPVPNRLIIHYRMLIDRPVPAIAAVIRRMTGDLAVDVRRLRDAIDAADVRTYPGVRL